jgi:hypothetical protein
VLPTDSARPPRRVLLVLAVGSALVGSGCDGVPGVSGDGAGTGAGGSSRTTPTVDPAVAAAVRTVGGHLTQLSARYAEVARRHPTLKAKLATATKHHAAHLARLKALGDPTTTPAPATTKPPAIAATPTAALADLVSREQALAVAHATVAAGLSGEPARVLASIAASETQIALSLAPAATGKGRR